MLATPVIKSATVSIFVEAFPALKNAIESAPTSKTAAVNSLKAKERGVPAAPAIPYPATDAFNWVSVIPPSITP